MCDEMLHVFYHNVVASVLLYAAVCWGCRRPDSLKTVVEKLKAIMDNSRYLLFSLLTGQRSSSDR